MGILQYAKNYLDKQCGYKGTWVGGKWFFKRSGAKKTDGNCGRREGAGMRELRLRVDSGEGRKIKVAIVNEGNDDLVVDGVLLPAGHCAEHMATPHVHRTRLRSQLQLQHFDPITINNPPVIPEPPAYITVYNDPPPSLNQVFPRPTFNYQQDRTRYLIRNMRRCELIDTIVLARAFHGTCNFSCVGLTTDEIRERVIDNLHHAAAS
jgi:hypothetical protein